ncbi:unnamed protein product, partial [Didymodactylos carnosus]
NHRCATGTTANIRRHLANSHGLSHLRYKSQLQKSTLISNAKKKSLDDAAIKCIVRDSRPFNEFRRPGMKIVLEQATPGYRGPHSKTVRRRLVPLYLQKQHDLKHQLSIVDHIALTTDLWQSGRKHYFLCVTAHYVTHQFEVSALFDPKVHDLMSQDDKLNAENFIKDEYKKRAKASSKSSSSSANTISSNDPGGSATTPGQASKFDQFLNKCGVKTTISSGNTKNRHLTIQEQSSKLRLLLKDSHDFMSFWSEYSSSIRDLSKLARKYMAIPATSAPSERI